jgi:hypothetical protein
MEHIGNMKTSSFSEEIMHALDEMRDDDDVLLVKANTIDERSALNLVCSSYSSMSTVATYYPQWRENFVYKDLYDTKYIPLASLTWTEDTLNDRSFATIQQTGKDKGPLCIYYENCPEKRLQHYKDNTNIISMDYNAVAVYYRRGHLNPDSAKKGVEFGNRRGDVSTNESRRMMNLLKGTQITDRKKATEIVDNIKNPQLMRVKAYHFSKFCWDCYKRSRTGQKDAMKTMLSLIQIHGCVFFAPLPRDIQQTIVSFIVCLQGCRKCILCRY